MVSNRFLQHIEQLKKRRAISSNVATRLLSLPHPPTADERALLQIITAPHFGERLFLVNTPKEPFGEMWIHWYYLPRTEDKLTLCETFHVNMLCAFDVPSRVKMIHIRCASTAPAETEAMRTAIGALSYGKAKIDFQIVTPKPSWEHDTIKECAEYAVATGKYVYYTHFKGVTRLQPGVAGCVVRQHAGITDVNELYWAFLMYWGLFCAFPAGTPVIGPLRYKGICKTFSRKDTGWSKGPGVHCAGSFQAFDGKLLAAEFDKMQMGKERREKLLWDGDTHIVEMLLTAVFPLDMISSIGNFDAGGAYRTYGRGIFPRQLEMFKHLYRGAFAGAPAGCKSVCVANGSYRRIGGTDTFSWALCKALLDLGYTVYYYAPDMDGKGVTEQYLQEIGVLPYDGSPLIACFASQQSGKRFVGMCPVVQTCHSKYTMLEFPMKGAKAYVSISEEIQQYLKARGYDTHLMRTGCDLERYAPRQGLQETPRVLSICQGDDALLRDACKALGWRFASVPKDVDRRVWHVEDLINQADIVVGIGRSLYDGMACGRACISWDNRALNPYTGCGYVTEGDWHAFARTNFTGRGYPQLNTVEKLIAELKKYGPRDGEKMRKIVEEELDMRKCALRYLELALE